MPAADEQQPGQPPQVRQLGTVPVYNCHVYLSGPDAGGRFHARGANLAELQASGTSQREVLQSVVQAFKRAVSGYTARGETIPWLESPLTIAVGESPRWVPVHF